MALDAERLQKHVGSEGLTYEKTKSSERERSTSPYLQTLISWLCREVYTIISDPHPHTYTRAGSEPTCRAAIKRAGT